MTNGREQDPRHPMGVVVRRTGITAHMLRPWEKWYGLVRPARTANGRPLNSEADNLRLLVVWQAPLGTRSA